MASVHRSSRVRAVWLLLVVALVSSSRDVAADDEPQAPAKSEMDFVHETVTYKTVGDCDIQADVFRGPGEGVRPAVMWIHGGALIFGQRNMGASSGLLAELTRLLDAGLVVVSIDYRLAPETPLPEIISDLQDAWRWVRTEGAERFQIDPDRIAVAGQSAGGYLTLMSGFTLKPRPQALVSFYGYGDITGEWLSQPDPFYTKNLPAVSEQQARAAVGDKPISPSGDGGRGAFYLWCRQQGRWPLEVSGIDPAEDPRAFDRYCPVRNVTKAYPPTLMLHGDQDNDVPHTQSEQMAALLKKQGVEHRLIIMPGYGHGFDMALETDQQVAETFDEAVTFLQQHLNSANDGSQ